MLAGVAAVLLVGLVVWAVLAFTDAGAVEWWAPATPTSPPPSATPTSGPPTASLTPTAVGTPTESVPGTYVVQEGDTLVSIAERFGVDLLVLISVNNITDPAALTIGTELVIPKPGTALPTDTPVVPSDLAPGTKVEHRVRQGETLQSIADLYHSTIERIVEENELEDADSIQVGQLIVVPANIATPVPTPTITPTSKTPTPTATPTP